MKNHIIHLFTVSLLLFSLSGCIDDDKENSILFSKTWKRGVTDLNPSTNPLEDVLYAPVEDCEKDDTYIFLSEGKLRINRGSEKCNEGEEEYIQKDYVYDEVQSTLIIDDTTYRIAEVSRNQIKLYLIVPYSITQGRPIVYLLQ